MDGRATPEYLEHADMAECRGIPRSGDPDQMMYMLLSSDRFRRLNGGATCVQRRSCAVSHDHGSRRARGALSDTHLLRIRYEHHRDLSSSLTAQEVVHAVVPG